MARLDKAWASDVERVAKKGGAVEDEGRVDAVVGIGDRGQGPRGWTSPGRRGWRGADGQTQMGEALGTGATMAGSERVATRVMRAWQVGHCRASNPKVLLRRVAQSRRRWRVGSSGDSRWGDGGSAGVLAEGVALLFGG